VLSGIRQAPACAGSKINLFLGHKDLVAESPKVKQRCLGLTDLFEAENHFSDKAPNITIIAVVNKPIILLA
jgi:hypothetical protein